MNLEGLFEVGAHWAYLVSCETRDFGDFVAALNPSLSKTHHIVRGNRCRDRHALFSELSEAMEFPSYFGENWDALDECLTDLEWLDSDGYVVLISEADQLLIDEPTALSVFLDVLRSAASYWMDGDALGERVAFHVVFQIPPNSPPETLARLEPAQPRALEFGGESTASQ